MAISDMYPAMVGSPVTTTTADIGAQATSISVSDGSVFPDGPNLAVLSDGENVEIVLYRAKSGGTLSNITRGMGNSTAKPWGAGTDISRNITSFDHDRFIENIQTLASEKAPIASPTFTGAPTAPTAAAGTNTTQIATTAFVASAVSGKANTDDVYSKSSVDTLLAAKAPLASPAFTGHPTGVTESASNNSTRLATTAFVKTAISGKQDTLTDSGWSDGWTDSIFSSSDGKIYFRKWGKIVEVYGWQVKLATTLEGSSYVESSGTIDSAYRPNTNRAVFLCGGVAGIGQITFETNGKVRFYKQNTDTSWSSTRNINFSGMYFAEAA